MKLILKGAAIGLLAISSTACNSSGGGATTKFLESLDLKVTQSGDESFISMTSVFDLGNVSLSELQVAVKDPKTTKDIGTVSFSQLPNGQAQISLNVNAALIGHADADLGMTMPNNNPIPLALGASRGDILGVPVLSSSRVYVGGDAKKVIYAGVALGIDGLDQVMARLNTPANIFFMANFGANLMGDGGIYGSSVKNQNGIAIFGKYTAGATQQAQMVDTRQDNQLEKLDRKTQNRLMNFFYGKHRTVKIK